MASIKADEITKIIREQIENYQQSVAVEEVGSVISVGDGIALNLEEDQVGPVLLGEYALIKEGDTVKRTGNVMSVPVGEALIGRVVNPLGEPLDGKGPIMTEQRNPVERLAPGVVDRQAVREPLQNGLKDH